MEPNFYPYKYATLPTVYSLSKTEKQAVDFGWKCRKSINWKDLHTSEDDRPRLKRFGDAIIEENKIILPDIGAVYQVLLKRSKYVASSKSFSREAKLATHWTTFDQEVDLALSSELYLGKRINELAGRLLEGISERDIPNWLRSTGLEIFLCWHLIGVVCGKDSPELVEENRNEMIGLFSPPKPIITIKKWLIDFIEPVYSSYGCPLPKKVKLTDTTLLDVLESTCKDFGVSATKIRKTSPQLPEESELDTKREHIEYFEKEGADFLTRVSQSGTTMYKVNLLHPYLKRGIINYQSEDNRRELNTLIKAIVSAYQVVERDEDKFESFIKYLSMKLKTNDTTYD